MTTRTTLCTLAVLLGTTGNALALKPGVHADIAKTSCRAAGLPRDFCTRIATEDYDTDAREWEDLRAHAQIDDGETACIAADRTAARVWQLGGELRRALDAATSDPSYSNIGNSAAAAGRVLHTIQDNCAHHGMPNPQHAWLSISDFCDGTELSPDTQDDAAECARTETDVVMGLIARAVRDRDLDRAAGRRACPPEHDGGSRNNNHTQSICQRRFLPGPIDACRFFASAKSWDGIDRTWENPVVVSALRAAFAAGLNGRSMIAPVCGGDDSVLSSATSQPVADVSAGAPTCGLSKLICLGKADGVDSPFYDEEFDGPQDEVGGCATNGSGGDSGVGLLLIAGALVHRRRRAR